MNFSLSASSAARWRSWRCLGLVVLVHGIVLYALMSSGSSAVDRTPLRLVEVRIVAAAPVAPAPEPVAAPAVQSEAVPRASRSAPVERPRAAEQPPVRPPVPAAQVPVPELESSPAPDSTPSLVPPLPGSMPGGAVGPTGGSSASPSATPTPSVLPPGTATAVAAAPTAPTARPIALVCPRQVRPGWPVRAARDSINGMVLARATVRGGRVVQVDIVESRPQRLFDAEVRQAMLQYRCETTGEGDVTVEQLFEFKLGE